MGNNDILVEFIDNRVDINRDNKHICHYFHLVVLVIFSSCILSSQEDIDAYYAARHALQQALHSPDIQVRDAQIKYFNLQLSRPI